MSYLQNQISRYAGNLVGGITATYTGQITISPAPKLNKEDGTSEFLTEVGIIVSSNKAEDYPSKIGAEEFALENGVENADDSATYDQVTRGIANNSSGVTPGGHVNWQTSHQDGAPVIIDPTYTLRAMDAAFDAGSDTGTAEVVINDLAVGQPFEFVDQGDGTSKIKPFNGGVVGGVVTVAAVVGAVASYQKITRGTISGLTGHIGVGGENAYADYTDATDSVIKASSESPSANARPIGIFKDDSTVYLGFSVDRLEKASQAEAEAGIDDTKYMTSLIVKNSIQSDLSKYSSAIGASTVEDMVATVTSVSNNGSSKAQFTSVGHGYVDGEIITLSGFTEATYNVSGTIANTTTNTFDIETIIFVDDDSGTATQEGAHDDGGGNAVFTSENHILVDGELIDLSTFTETSYNRTGVVSDKTDNTFKALLYGEITAVADDGGGDAVFTSDAHGLSNGDEVVIAGTTSYDGTKTVSSVTTNTFETGDSYVDDETGTFQASTALIAYVSDDTGIFTTQADDYRIRMTPTLETLADGLVFSFKADKANTGACTLQIDETTQKTIKKFYGAIVVDLDDSDIVGGQTVTVRYNLDEDCFIMESQSAQVKKYIDDSLGSSTGTVTVALTPQSKGTQSTSFTPGVSGTLFVFGDINIVTTNNSRSSYFDIIGVSGANTDRDWYSTTTERLAIAAVGQISETSEITVQTRGTDDGSYYGNISAAGTLYWAVIKG